MAGNPAPETSERVPDGWQARLRDQGFRITPQRQLVLQAVERLGHATPDELLVEVQRTATGINVSTVYRALEVLEDVGLVTHAHIGHGAPTYHAVEEPTHIHLVCDRCGDVLSAPASMAEDFVRLLDREFGFRADISHVSVQGRCGGCAEVAEPGSRELGAGKPVAGTGR